MKYFLAIFLACTSLHAKQVFKVVTVHEFVGWEWKWDAKGNDRKEYLNLLNSLSADKNIKNVTILCDNVVFYQQKIFQSVTETVRLGDSDVIELKKLVDERLDEDERKYMVGYPNSWDVYFCRNWAMVQTASHAMFRYYYKVTDKGWKEMNEPMNGEGPVGAPDNDDFKKRQ